ncbi:MAG: hypothetical protein JOS17DRAFT_162774 [Linnemannia elongata]|nr:MAG: hypothetical protein JOS17DRAFT_162774 [Linnemannia elongata]
MTKASVSQVLVFVLLSPVLAGLLACTEQIIFLFLWDLVVLGPFLAHLLVTCIRLFRHIFFLYDRRYKGGCSGMDRRMGKWIGWSSFGYPKRRAKDKSRERHDGKKGVRKREKTEKLTSTMLSSTMLSSTMLSNTMLSTTMRTSTIRTCQKNMRESLGYRDRRSGKKNNRTVMGMKQGMNMDGMCTLCKCCSPSLPPSDTFLPRDHLVTT